MYAYFYGVRRLGIMVSYITKVTAIKWHNLRLIIHAPTYVVKLG